MGCMGGLNAGARHRGLGGPTREQMEKAKEAIQFLSSIDIGEPSDGVAAESTSLEEAGSSSSGKLCLMCFRICCGIYFCMFFFSFFFKIAIAIACR